MLVMKRVWLLAALLGFALLTGGWYFFLEEEVCEPLPEYIMQTITADSKSSRTITWQTAPVQTGQKLVYREGESGREVAVEAQRAALTTGAEARQLHSVTLRGLKPGAAYAYKVGGENNWSPWQSLQTEESVSPGFKAIVFGDSQCEDYGVWQKTAQAAWADHSDARFFINMGDLVDIGSHYAQWQAWLDGGAGMIATIPAVAISGNHENYLPGGTFSPAALYLELFRLPENGPAGLARQAYSFDYGDVHFVAIDTQEQELAEFQPDLIKQELQWLEADLAATQKKWKVVLAHRSLFQNNYAGQPNELGERIMPILARCQVDIVFTAHIHTYGRSAPLPEQPDGKADGPGTIYIATGRSGDKTWAESRRKRFETVFDDCLDQPNYLILETQPGVLRVTNFKQDGSLADTVELKK